MLPCQTCGASHAESAHFCPTCGTQVYHAQSHTSTPTDPSTTRTSAPGPTSPQTPPLSDHTRFIPSTVLAKRYRIIGMLGRGGMGEVYRADDLKLGQQVALKFLPANAGDQPERLLSEVRFSLRVTHANVCRVFDLGEIDGEHFLSMEYVDGEDLSVLLRRIGRLPEDKAIETARQVCAGLAAAHAENVLHRDLKPANIMIDGRGRAKITDFGLAGATQGIRGVEARYGTPGYMAPEQHQGGELTERSDIYALGLVLYEIFTGRRAFDAKSPAEIAAAQQTSTPTSPSSHITNLDPSVERVIMRCLAHDPAERPASVAAVAAALPGGDPLAAAVAAGETPSPEMVAAADAGAGLTVPKAWTLLGLVVAISAVSLLINGALHAVNVIRPQRPPAVLEDVARKLLNEIDPELVAGDHLSAFAPDFDGEVWARENSSDEAEFHQALRDLPVLTFWYRQSPYAIGGEDGFVTDDYPPFITPGAARVWLDHAGRLRELKIIPAPILAEPVDSAEQAPSTTQASEPDWSVLFNAAGFDLATFNEVTPTHTPPVFADRVRSWESTWPDHPNAPVKVRAASLAGRPVLFEVVAPWRAEDVATLAPSSRQNVWAIIFIFLPLLVGGILARRNARMGRGDRVGATVFAAAFLIDHTIVWLVRGHHSSTHFARDFYGGIGRDVLVTAALWLL